MIVHIVDVSSPSREKQESAVTGVLGEMKASDKPRLTMWNKLDLLPEEEQVPCTLCLRPLRDFAASYFEERCEQYTTGWGLGY